MAEYIAKGDHRFYSLLAANVPDMKIYIKSELKSDRFRMYTENFRISRNVCLFFIFVKFSKPARAGDAKRRFCFRMA